MAHPLPYRLDMLIRSAPSILCIAFVTTIGCSSTPAPRPTPARSSGEDAIARAFEQRASNVQVEGHGVVRRILSDDNDGSRHQRFVVALGSGQTVLIAHNVDLAARVEGLNEGDEVSFSGEYVWNAEGGVVHWTHRDPSNRHKAGWIEHAGHVYQ